METETVLYQPKVRQSSGKGDEAVVQQSHPLSTRWIAPLARTGTPLPGESHNAHSIGPLAARIPAPVKPDPTPLSFELVAGLPTGASRSFISVLMFLPDKAYELVKPIPICIDQVQDAEFVACFEKAGIAMSADTLEDAVKALSEHLLDVFESFTENESVLDPGPISQLALLRSFIRERKR